MKRHITGNLIAEFLALTTLLAVALVASLPLGNVALTQLIRNMTGETSHMTVPEEANYRASLAKKYGDVGLIIDVPLKPGTYEQALQDTIGRVDSASSAVWKHSDQKPGPASKTAYRAAYRPAENTVYINQKYLTVSEMYGVLSHEMSHVRWNERVTAGVEDEDFINDTYGEPFYSTDGLEKHADCEAISAETVVTHYWDCAAGNQVTAG